MVNSITNRQMFFLIILSLTSYSVVPITKDMAESAGTGSWIPIVAATLFFELVAVIIVSLNNMFKGEMLFDYSSRLVSKAGSYVLAVYYIVYFLFIAVFLVDELAILLNANFFPRTPIWFIPLIAIPVSCIIAYKGITNIARLGEIIGIIFIVTAFVVHSVMITQGDVSQVLPLFNGEEIGGYFSGLKHMIFPFLGLEVLLIVPFTKKNEKARKTAFFAVLLIGIFYILIVASCIMLLGLNTVVHYKDALIVAIRSTAPKSIEFFTRFDILYLTVGFSGLYMGISIVLLAITEYLCRVFSRVKRRTIVIILGTVAYFIFLTVSGVKGYEEFAEEAGTYLGLFAGVLIPVLLFIIGKIKLASKKGKKGVS